MAIVGYSGLWNGVYNENHSLSGTEEVLMRKVGKVLNKAGMRAIQELMLTLNGTVAGSAALKQHDRVEANTDGPGEIFGGGQVPIETIDDVNRVTTSGDKTTIDGYLVHSSAPVYPGDLSGNGK